MGNWIDILGTPKNASQDDLAALRIPDRKEEFWKYINLKGITGQKWNQVSKGRESKKGNDIVIQDGHLLNIPQDLKGVKVDAIQAGTASANGGFNDVFQVLSSAYATSGLHIEVAKNEAIGTLRVNAIASAPDVFVALQHQIVVRSGGSATIVLDYQTTGDQASFIAPSTHVKVEANARLKLVIIQEENIACQHVENVVVEQAADSYFGAFTLTTGGAFVRNNIHVTHEGSGLTTVLNGAYLPGDGQIVDNHTRINHMFPNCESHEAYKGILAGKGMGVFNGKVFVDPVAQKTNAFQSNQNILLSDTAEMNSKPELEIYADDVKCSHGSTTGALDESALFYLQTRGIGKKAGRNLLIQAFVNEVFEDIEDESLREELFEKLTTKLNEIA